ncbi:MAG: MFS transporter, partial [Candidatus Thorarchaeota archaeon]
QKWPWHLFIWLLIILAIVNIGGNSINQLIQIHIRLPETFAASDVIVAQLRNTSSISMIIAGLVIGFLVSRFGDGKMLLVGFICAFVGTIALPFAPHIIIFFIYMSLKGFSRVWIQTTAYSMVNRVVPLETRGKMMGYYNAVFYLSWGLGGTVLTGPIADSIVASNITIILIYVILGIFLIGTWLYLIIRHLTRLEVNKNLMYIVGVFWLSILGLIAGFLAKPFAEIIIATGSSDAYAYVVTFYVAAILIAIGILTYIFYRPKNYLQLVTDKNNAIIQTV